MQKKTNNFWVAVFGCLLLCTSIPVSAEWVEWVLDPEIEYHFDDNVNLSAFDADTKSDHVISAALQAGRYLQMGERTRLRLTAGVEVVAYDHWDKLNNTALGGSATLTHKLGLGPNAVWLSPYLTMGYRNVKSDIRSGRFLDVGFAVGRRFTDRFDMSASIAYTEGDGKDGVLIVPGIGADVFDQDRWIFAVQGNFLLTNRLILQGEISHYEGEFVSACTVDNVGTVLASEMVRAITLDDVFGGCVYRLKGDGNRASLDLSYATGRHSSFNAGVSFLAGEADVLDYENTVFRASFMYSY